MDIRNIAIIAHVDHGKTTLVDCIIKNAQIFRENEQVQECLMDNNDLERERGITILSKNMSINYKGVKLNIIDTPGHADFGGQVERVLKMADGVLLLVDAAEGPMPQTRFVLEKALKLGLKPIVFINKIDKDDARQDKVLDMVFDLFVELDANDDQLDFVTLYGSGRDNYASLEEDGGNKKNIIPLLDTLIETIPAPKFSEGSLQMQVTTIDSSNYTGRIGIGRVYRNTLKKGENIKIIKNNGKENNGKILQLFTFEGLGKKEVQEVACGDLCAVVGIEDIDVGDTITDIENPEAMPKIVLDEPTISMLFRVNDSPFFGKEGELISSRHITERLLKEQERDVALKVEQKAEKYWEIKGRGVLHLSVLIENMRREGYEFSISRPQVIYRNNGEGKEEPIEELTVDVPEIYAGKTIELIGARKGEMLDMQPGTNRTIIKFSIPTRGLIGLRSKLLTLTSGEAIVASRFLRYAPFKGEIPFRTNGVLISMGAGKVAAYSLNNLQARGKFFVEPTVDVYEGMIVGEHNKDSDLTVNVQKGKQLTNVRASGSDKAIKIAPAIKMSLEQSIEYINDDEIIEITPKNIRLRKLYLTEVERKKHR